MGDRTKKHPKRNVPPSLNSPRALLITRRQGGLGDILMTRPIFHAIKASSPESIVTYALPSVYAQAMADVDDVDCVVPIGEVNPHDWPWHADISTACLKHEVGYRSKVFMHRTNVWSSHIGLGMIPVSTRFKFTREEIEYSRSRIKAACGSSDDVMLITPFSADKTKDMSEEIIWAAATWAKQNGMSPVILHYATKSDAAPTVSDMTIREWMASFASARMVFSTDTAGVHMAGFLRVPTCGVFSFTSKDVMCAYYPTVAPVQLHRDSEGGMACCPCYDPGACPYVTKSDRRLPCVTKITQAMVVEGLEAAAAMPRADRMFTEGPLRPYRSMKMISTTRPSSKVLHSVMVDLRGTGRIGIVASCAIINAIIEVVSNIPIYAAFDDDQREMVSCAPFTQAWRSEKCSAVVEVSKILEAKDPVDVIKKMIGINVVVFGSGIHISRQSTTKADDLVPGRNYHLVTSERLGDGKVVPSCDLPTMMAMIRKASSVTSDDDLVTLLSTLSGTKVTHVGQLGAQVKSLVERWTT